MTQKNNRSFLSICGNSLIYFGIGFSFLVLFCPPFFRFLMWATVPSSLALSFQSKFLFVFWMNIIPLTCLFTGLILLVCERRKRYKDNSKGELLQALDQKDGTQAGEHTP